MQRFITRTRNNKVKTWYPPKTLWLKAHVKNEFYNIQISWVILNRVTECMAKNFFRYKMCHNSQKHKSWLSKKIHIDIYLYLLRICAIFLGKVTTNKKDKGKRRPPIYKHTFIQVLSFIFRFRSTLSLSNKFNKKRTNKRERQT